MRNRPSAHFLLLLLLFLLNLLAYLAVYRSGILRGYAPSLLLAGRDLALCLPILFVLVWLVKRQRYAGDLTLLTVAILLFSVGQIVQYRLFSDPEYGARRKSEARLAKTNTLRQRYVNQYYDADKKRALFGDPNFKIPVRSAETAEASEWSLARVLFSTSTWIPIVSLAGFVFAFALARRDDVLLRLQRHSFTLGMLATIPFALIAIFYSSGGKFLGRTTPWEPVKVAFVVSCAGMLTDQYRHLSRTNWGLPPLGALLPFLVVALLPLVPFFALADFGQMLVFAGVLLTLYLVAVRRVAQVVIAAGALALLLGASILIIGTAQTVADLVRGGESATVGERVGGVASRGVPRRIHQRFYLWLEPSAAPNPEEAWWWSPESEAAEGRGLSNEEAWYNSYAFQPSQALFGVADGRALGAGFGRGFPELVPIADSDFIYAAIAEEMGLVGGAIVIFAFVILVVAGMRAAIEARDMFTKLLAAGVTTFLGFQAIVNIGGVIRLLPMTGITLPFVSHGGWSLITSFVMLGILMAVSHRNAAAPPAAQYS